MSTYHSLVKEHIWISKHIKGPLYRVKMLKLYLRVNEAIKDPNVQSQLKLRLIGLRDQIKTKL